MKLYLGVINFFKSHKIKFTIFLLLLISISIFFTEKVSFQSTIFDFIPDNTSLCKSLRLLEHLQKSSEIIIHLKLEDKEDSLDKMIVETDKLKILLALKDFTIKDFGTADFFHDYEGLLNYIPIIFSKNYENFIKEKISADNILKQMTINYKTLLTPIGSFQKIMIKDDPLLLGRYFLGKLKGFSKILGSEVVLENGLLLSRDYKNSFLIVSNSDSSRNADQIIHDLKLVLKDVDSSITTEIISSYIHSSFNEKVIKRDARMAVILAVVALLFIILFLFKDIKGMLVFLIPSLSFFPAILVLNLFFEKVSLITIGFGAMIIGISIDYGIHLFSSIKNYPASNKGKDVLSVFRPLTLSLLSTLGAFSLFFVSSSIGYRQLALFSISSISLTFLFSALILPVFIKPSMKTIKTLSFSPLKSSWFIRVGFLILVFLSVLALKNKFQYSIRFFDNTPLKVFEAEEQFMKIFGKSSIPLIMSTGSSLEIALQNEEMIADKIEGGIFVSSLIPSQKRKLENIKRWNRFWSENRKKLKKDVIESASSAGFSDKVFNGFFKRLEEVDSGKILVPVLIKEMASGSFIIGQEKVDVISYLLETGKLSDIKMMINDKTEYFLFFKDYFLKDISDSTFKELKELLVILLIIVLFFFIFLPYKKELFLVSVPVVMGVLAPLAVLRLSGNAVNAAHIAGLIIVFGLCVDYGVFMIFQLQNLESAHIYQGIKISVITTVTGAFALLLAKHTILSSLGFAIFFGVLSGFLASIMLLPPVYFYLEKAGKTKRLATESTER